MFEMLMLLGFVYAAFCHLLPLPNHEKSVGDVQVRGGSPAKGRPAKDSCKCSLRRSSVIRRSLV